MKKVFKTFVLASLCGASLLLTQSCTKVIPAKDVTWSGIDVTETVPIVSDTALDESWGTSSFTYNLDSMIKSETSNTLGIKNITKVTIDKCELTVQNPDSADNFANFQLCYLNFHTDKDTVTAHAASIANNPDAYAETLDVPFDNSLNLVSYLYTSSDPSSTTTFTYAFGGKLRRPTTKILTVNVHVEYTIHVQP